MAIRMMPASVAHREPWQQQLVEAIRDPAELLSELRLPQSLLAGAERGAELFRVMVTRSFLDRMERGDASDPLLRQILPVREEGDAVVGYVSDPLQEASARKAPGLIQKYGSRVLLLAAGSCAINCRYCFRRDYPYEDEPRQLDDWDAALQTISADDSINEVILSGGDPLVLNDARIDALLSRLEAIEHLAMVRIHSRLPIVLPDRVTETLISRLRHSRLQPVIVVHSNHPNEIAGECAAGLARLVRSGLPTLNQTVLLRSINDSADVLVSLSRRLTGVGVIPYYLHRLDRVKGTAHFSVETARGEELIAQMRRELPGYAVPRFVVEEPGIRHKTVIA